MHTVSKGLVGLVALLHLAFFVYESFFWRDEATRLVMVNQGFYNAFLAAGLIWALRRQAKDLATFFLACILVAGLVGGWTAKPVIYAIQALPAFLALVSLRLPTARRSGAAHAAGMLG